MRQKHPCISLSAEDRKFLLGFLHSGKHTPAELRNCYILLDCDEEACKPVLSDRLLSSFLITSPRTIERVRSKYIAGGVESAVFRKKLVRAYNTKIGESFEADLLMLLKSPPPKGYKRWSLRLLSDHAAEAGLIESVSHETIRKVLKRHHVRL